VPRPNWSTTVGRRPCRRICRRLDGLPLAIELAASRLKVLSLTEIDERLADRFRLLRRVATADVPPRQRTLRATIDWSYGLLDEPERCLLRRLSVFAGGFGLDSVEAVCAGGGVGEEDVLDLVAGLVDKSLVVRGEHADRARHRLLDSVRDFAAERCANTRTSTCCGRAASATSRATRATTSPRPDQASIGAHGRREDNSAPLAMGPVRGGPARTLDPSGSCTSGCGAATLGSPEVVRRGDGRRPTCRRR
jgi:predicted ATPase